MRVKDNPASLHIWKESAGVYICECGAKGELNTFTNRVEVVEPIPFDSYKIRHGLSIPKAG